MMVVKIGRLVTLFLLLIIGANCRQVNSPIPMEAIVPTAIATPGLTEAATAAATATATATVLPTVTPVTANFGVLGDSFADEYRANDGRGGAYGSFTLNWVELLSLHGINFGSWGIRTEPRRIGYSFNWARSGATAAEMRAQQVAGLVTQVQAGAVRTVILHVGTNDFSPQIGNYQEIYNGMSPDELAAKLDGIVQVIELSLTELQAAGAEELLLVSIFDPNLRPEREQEFPDIAGRQVVSDAIQDVNGRLQAVAAAHQVPFANINVLIAQFEADSEDGLLDVGGEQIDIWGVGNEPHYGVLPDEHAGTVLNGLIARHLMKQLNDYYGTDYLLLSDEQILTHAGLEEPKEE